MNDIELYEQARKRVQKKNRGRCVRNKDVIVDQEKEIIYYREKINTLRQMLKQRELTEGKNNFSKELEFTIKEEEYLIKYNVNTDTILLTMCINKIINEPGIDAIFKQNEFRIYNNTRMKKHEEQYKEIQKIRKLWQS